MKLLLKLATISVWCIFFVQVQAQPAVFTLNEKEYFESEGVNILAFSNWYFGLFSDSKISGIEIIHHGVRTSTNGDVRLHNAPEQWDALPTFIKRDVDPVNQRVDIYQHYPDYDFQYMIRAEAIRDGVQLSVHLEEPLPEVLSEIAGFNLEFLPSAYFEKSFTMDGKPGFFPLYPMSGTSIERDSYTSPKAFARGQKLVLAPGDQERKVIIESTDADLMIFDGRTKAQNGWFVVRSMLPANQTGKVLEWTLKPSTTPGWKRAPVIGHSQVGYHPRQNKVAVIEMDQNQIGAAEATLIKIDDSGTETEILKSGLQEWGGFMRYRYGYFDFSNIRDRGLYKIRYHDVETALFPISDDVYETAWHPTNDIFFPVQMDHMLVNEAYRVWHGASHLDDALQAPAGHVHFDLYAMGPTTDTKFEPGEHIPGLNVGGWYDAGDYDIRTQTQYYVVNNLAHTYEQFRPDRDQVLVDYSRKFVDLHHPDGKNDMLQQIEHGCKALIAQFDAIGHAIHGIIVPTLGQYTHLGDGITMTDNLIYDSGLDSTEVDCDRSGIFDDRWAFTTRATALNYGSIAALTAASRVLRGYNDQMSSKCLSIAKRIWDEEQSHEPFTYRHGNTTGGRIEDEELKATAELLITTGDSKYRDHLDNLWPVIDSNFTSHAGLAALLIDHMDVSYKKQLESRTRKYVEAELAEIKKDNPYGVPINRGGWGGAGRVVAQGLQLYQLHKAFPNIISKEEVYKCLNYVFGTHPGSDISFVSGVGTQSKKVAYGMNRADYSFIAGGIVPGILILKPDYPENKEDWPFLWGENEYVISVGSSYIYLLHAVMDLLENEN